MPLPDPATFSANMMKVATQSQTLVSEFLASQREKGVGSADPLNIGGAFMELFTKMMSEPSKIVEAQLDLWQRYMDLWTSQAQRFLGQESDPLVQPERGDRRFRDPQWDENQVFDYIKQSYLLTARWMQDTVKDVDGLDDRTAKKVDFYTRQFVDAMAPSNFLMTNPQVLRATLESNGENLVRGLDNMLKDLDRNSGRLHIRMTDMDAFKVGENVAVTPGKVIYQNDLMQLLQYTPTTQEVYKRPLFIVPPWINKFYIMDLRPENSFISWMLDRGYTVFVVSWRNPDETLTEKTFEDYLKEGIFDGLDAVEKATGEREVTTIGYCIGGTLMACALAVLAARGDDRIKATTFFAAQVDFSEAGELSVFIDDEQLEHIEQVMAERGYLAGNEMATTFNMLRANDLIWSFVVNNYLLGKDPFPFDLLYWNADATNMPAKMHSYYLRNMYQKNLLVQPGALHLCGVDLDLRKIKVPIYLQSSKEDHIAPFTSVYKASQLYSGPVRFVLAGSGHIAGVINPPSARKYQHWTSDIAKNPPTPEEWLATATEHPGSWWEDWDAWLSTHSGPKVPARVPGDGKLKVIEDAPGSYVKSKGATANWTEAEEVVSETDANSGD
ncbi:PHA/PHB synthase family protein [Marinibaculum pumilum]|uniref:PHA/PHB synthase family protein n=1 Tax=Marinibaculum pumilum TaxID=1766165 RepID=A0ABV7KUT5_9PROT